LIFYEAIKETALSFFKHCIVEVTDRDITTKRYDESKSHILEKQLIKCDFSFMTYMTSFEKVINNICSSGNSRINAF
jgi:hypothetical protein